MPNNWCLKVNSLLMNQPASRVACAANRDHKRVCKTCYAVFKERTEEPEKQENKFLTRIIGIEWDEVNPNKMAKNRTAGRRGEK